MKLGSSFNVDPNPLNVDATGKSNSYNIIYAGIKYKDYCSKKSLHRRAEK
jgi:hypothetical protein